MDAIDSALAVADRAWRAYGAGAADRAALAADLRSDLEAAAADGVGPDRLLGPDVAAFARTLAEEAGVERIVAPPRRLLGVALIGAALGGAVALLLLELTVSLYQRLLSGPDAAGVPVQVAVGLYYGVPAAIVVAGAVAAVRIGLSDASRTPRTAAAMCLLLPLAGLLVTPLTMAVASATGYSTGAVVVLSEVALVLAALAGATLLARRWSMRDRPGRARAPQVTAA